MISPYFVWTLVRCFPLLLCLDDCDFTWRSPPVGLAPLPTLSLDLVPGTCRSWPPVIFLLLTGIVSKVLSGVALWSEVVMWCWSESCCVTRWVGWTMSVCWDEVLTGEWVLLLWRLGGRLDCVAWDLRYRRTGINSINFVYIIQYGVGMNNIAQLCWHPLCCFCMKYCTWCTLWCPTR